MRNLILMRHGPAVSREKWAPSDDSLRPLTRKGRKVVRAVGKRLLSDGLTPDIILTSPLVRATETAEILAEVLGLQGSVILEESLAGDKPVPDMLQPLHERLQEARTVLVVGHEPSLSRLASTLISGSPWTGLDLRKGGWCLLAFERLRPGKCAVLRALVPPRPPALDRDSPPGERGEQA